MNINLAINDDETVTITKSNNYGYNLQHNYPTINPKTKEVKVGSKVTFHATLEQVAGKVVYLGLEGNSLDEVVDSVVSLSQRLTEALEKLQR
jgi:hypothetical protein